MAEISTKPYMLRAIHEWCTDSGFTPYIAVTVDDRTLVPPDFVRAGEIVLNVSSPATNRLEISYDLIQFQARLNGQAQDLSIPVENVSAIYARENGHGMAFDVPKAMALVADQEEQGDASMVRLVTPEVADDPVDDLPGDDDQAPAPRPRPMLTAVPDPVSSVDSGSDSNDGSDDEPDPNGDGTPGSADNNAGAARKPRGKPKLTRVK